MHLRITLGILAVAAACGQFVIAQPPERRDGPPPERRDPLRDALDTNGNHELDAEEIKNAAASLSKADKNGDGTIDHDEFRPPLPPITRGSGGFRGPPPSPEGESEGRPGRERGFRGEGRPPREGGGGGEGPPRAGGPSPERFVERALTFDADGDGKLDKRELEKFAGEMADRMRGAMAERRGMRDGAGPQRRPEGSEDGERSERPRRPE